MTQSAENGLPGATETDEYVVVWFPPEGDRERKFADDEDKARKFAARESVAEWHPLLVRRLTITLVTEEILPLSSVIPPARSDR